jgi:hypothetical protein
MVLLQPTYRNTKTYFVSLRVTTFLDFVRRLVLQRTQYFGSWISLHPYGKGLRHLLHIAYLEADFLVTDPADLVTPILSPEDEHRSSFRNAVFSIPRNVQIPKIQ